MLETNLCPICGDDLVVEYNRTHTEYYCPYYTVKTHTYRKRVVDNLITRIRVRYSNDEGDLFFKIEYLAGYMEVWTTSYQTNRIRINHVIEPDFANPEKMVAKFRTYLTFS